jgi:hypothetical protein
VINLYLTEQWRDIPGYKGLYQVSDMGRVRSLSRWKRSRGGGRYWMVGRVLQLSKSQDYPQVQLCRGGKIQRAAIARLVLLAFVGPCPPEHQVCHYPDQNTKNNKLANLRWGTAKENADDRIQHGTHPAGENNPRSKLTEVAVKEMRLLYSSGNCDAKRLAKMFRVSHSAAWQAVTKRTWRSVK